ncbi:valine--tRNA ligase [Patescibacteria group bacterium]|nr:MAG: valine--tRNA ligase [Patescibacteria group bacterium]
MTKKIELPKSYAPKDYEDALYRQWEKSGFFNPDKLPGRRPDSYCIVMPPPNVTGVLHIGHAVMLAIEDLLIRFERLRGKKTLWLPGTDHAAIATQNKVEKLLWEKEKKTRHALGREKFLARVKNFAQESHDTIVTQVKKMGSSCDWSREAYTLDAPRVQAVAEAFRRLHEMGLIYRGQRVVNWCPHCQSTLSDDEVAYRPAKEKLYWIKYGPFVLATARPETKLGDTAVAVHPQDQRYKKYVGRRFKIPGVLGEFEVVVVADGVVDREFGSGMIKVTPAHDFTDFEIAARHGVPMRQVIGEDGRMMANTGKYAGLTTAEARAAIVRDMEKMGLIEKIEEYEHNLSVCYRCGTTIEPLPKLQWFIAVNKPFTFRQSARSPIKDIGDGEKITLKELMSHVVKTGQIQIIPDRFVKTYFHWIDNLRDWNISRQIWFGHRIPVWHHDTCQMLGIMDTMHQPDTWMRDAYVILDKPLDEYADDEIVYCGKCKNGYTIKKIKEGHFTQDPDTLDTWFSSGLWTFSTLGWPAEMADFKNYHPTAVLETGYDILFFWVARMILMSLALIGEIPFKTVYLHGLVRDEQGRKMSKSLGNVIDPLAVAAKYGTDAVRLSLVLGTTPGNDTRLSEEKIAGFRNFTNKLWNIGRFVLSQTSISKFQIPNSKTLPDRWILSRLSEVTERVTRHLENYEFSAAGEILRDFTWGDFADWYLEISKVQKQSSPALAKNTDLILRHTLAVLLKLWHPFMPYVTEVLWRELQGKEGGLLLVASWPAPGAREARAEQAMKNWQETVAAIRNLRAEYKVPPEREVEAEIVSAPAGLSEELAWLEKLSRSKISAVKKAEKKGQAAALAGSMEIYVDLAGAVDRGRESARLQKERESLESYLAALEAKLKNNDFLKRAPSAVVEKEKEKAAAARDKLARIRRELTSLGADG